jgi:hypothetical protein
MPTGTQTASDGIQEAFAHVLVSGHKYTPSDGIMEAFSHAFSILATTASDGIMEAFSHSLVASPSAQAASDGIQEKFVHSFTASVQKPSDGIMEAFIHDFRGRSRHDWVLGTRPRGSTFKLNN